MRMGSYLGTSTGRDEYPSTGALNPGKNGRDPWVPGRASHTVKGGPYEAGYFLDLASG